RLQDAAGRVLKVYSIAPPQPVMLQAETVLFEQELAGIPPSTDRIFVSWNYDWELWAEPYEILPLSP
nr:hypothetical protein [Alphaproteobacteria bacterium]